MELLLDHAVDLRWAAENRAQLPDPLLQVLVLLLDLLPREPGEAREP